MRDRIKSERYFTEAIEKYLKEIWYARHRECVWYDSHKAKQNRYEGYWSYEAGAVAKICGIEDAALRECAYYPYDFVHFL